jgi:hypothetical protein
MNMTSTLHDRRPFVIRPIARAGWRQQEGDSRATHCTATANWLYIKRLAGEDAKGSIDYTHRNDLVAEGIVVPPKAPRWSEEPGRVWREIDEIMADRPLDKISAWHIVMSLPVDVTPAAWAAMVSGFAREAIAEHGMIADWAIHAAWGVNGEWVIRPHAHLLMTTNRWKHDARQGDMMPSWCGHAARSRLQADWLGRLPAPMRATALDAYRCGDYAPARLPLPTKLFLRGA